MSSEDNNELKQLFDKITTMVERNPKFMEAVEGLITDFAEAGYLAPDDSSMPPKPQPKCKRFSLNTLNPIAAKALEAFDFDGNGKVTVDNVARGAEMLKDTQKKYKRVTWAMVVQFVVYAILAGVSLGVLYYYLYLMKDMTVDETTGNLMIKTNKGVSDQEVSIKSHGETFSYDSFVVDPITGVSKGCVLGPNAVSMFRLLSEGTQTKFMTENGDSGDVALTSLGNGKVLWTNTSIDLGDGFALYPDADCTKKYLQGNLGGRKLSSTDLLDRHLDLREHFLSAMKGLGEMNTDGRHLLTAEGDVLYSTSAPIATIIDWDHLIEVYSWDDPDIDWDAVIFAAADDNACTAEARIMCTDKDGDLCPDGQQFEMMCEFVVGTGVSAAMAPFVALMERGIDYWTPVQNYDEDTRIYSWVFDEAWFEHYLSDVSGTLLLMDFLKCLNPDWSNGPDCVVVCQGDHKSTARLALYN